MIQHTLVQTDGEAFLTAFIPGHGLLSAGSTHPNFDKIKEAVVMGQPPLTNEALADLFDVARAVERRFTKLSRRVSVNGGTLFFDGDEIHNALAKQVVRFLDADVDNWKPLVAFFEKVQANPSAHSRNQLFEWLDRHDFTIDTDGDLVGYKGVMRDSDGKLVSVHAGPGIVDGVKMNGHLPNEVGSIVEIERSYVHEDPSVGCSRGLHVGTYDYAKGYASGALLRVKVNPADVVSVPTDCNAQKVRTCRYEVVEIIDGHLALPLVDSVDVAETLDERESCDAYGDDLVVGSRVVDNEGDEGEITEILSDGGVTVRFDYYGPISYSYSEVEEYGIVSKDEDDGLDAGDNDATYDGQTGTATKFADGSVLFTPEHADEGDGTPFADENAAKAAGVKRSYSGPTSQAAKGRGRNAAQDALGRFSNGRPGSQRDAGTGRFTA
jgi:hypothetical protein